MVITQFVTQDTPCKPLPYPIATCVYMYVMQSITTTVIREIFVVKQFSYSSESTRIKRTKYFQCTYYIIEHELNDRRVLKFFGMNILHPNIS